MDSTFTYTSADLEPAQEWTGFQMATWGVRAPHVDMWLRQAAELLGDGRTGRVVLFFDPDQRLLSLDVWRDDERVFGMDDLV